MQITYFPSDFKPKTYPAGTVTVPEKGSFFSGLTDFLSETTEAVQPLLHTYGQVQRVIDDAKSNKVPVVTPSTIFVNGSKQPSERSGGSNTPAIIPANFFETVSSFFNPSTPTRETSLVAPQKIDYNFIFILVAVFTLISFMKGR